MALWTPLYWPTFSCLKAITNPFWTDQQAYFQITPNPTGKGSKYLKPINFQFQLIEGTKSFQPLNGEMTLMASIFLWRALHWNLTVDWCHCFLSELRSRATAQSLHRTLTWRAKCLDVLFQNDFFHSAKSL